MQFFAAALDRERRPGNLLRGGYFCSALVSLGADFLGRKLASADVETRSNFFRHGLLFGRSDPGISRTCMDFAERVVTDYFDRTGGAAATIRSGFESAVANLPINGFVEFFGRPVAGKELIDAAMAHESATFSRDIPRPADIRGSTCSNRAYLRLRGPPAETF